MLKISRDLELTNGRSLKLVCGFRADSPANGQFPLPAGGPTEFHGVNLTDIEWMLVHSTTTLMYAGGARFPYRYKTKHIRLAIGVRIRVNQCPDKKRSTVCVPSRNIKVQFRPRARCRKCGARRAPAARCRRTSLASSRLQQHPAKTGQPFSKRDTSSEGG